MKIVVFSGAGVSAESGLGTFRDSNGLWENYDIKDVATPEAWVRNPKLVLDFYNMRRAEVKKAKPNLAHSSLVDLEEHFDVSIITQNIDDLHERAGSSHVLHLHGEIFKAKTYETDTNYIDVFDDISMGEVGENGLQLRPHVVWFGEQVPAMEEAIEIVKTANVLLVVGTSLQVYPAANLIFYANPSADLFLIDPQHIEHQFNGDHIQMQATEGVPFFVKTLMKKG